MNREEIDYWLRLFSNHNQSFMSKDGKKITLFKVFQELKELQYLLKTENDYIKELQQENKQLKEDISFCLHSIKQEMEMSTDSRTRKEMTTCYEILKRWKNE